MTEFRSVVPLPLGTRLEDFEVTGLIAEGGFGIVYAAVDHALDRRVALKEYMPGGLAMRNAAQHVVVRAPRHEAAFNAGLRSFLNEAQLLAAFDHPALVRVLSFWEGNGTAYMAMPLYEGRTLKQFLREHERPDEAWLRALLVPLLGALDTLHRAHCYHRDVAPDNIMILDTGAPILLDFGAARRIIANLTKDVTVILKPGYAPIEQYGGEVSGANASLGQGPWTDVYAVAAVLHFAITGKPPPTPVTRIMNDTLRPLRESVTGYSETLLAGIDCGLAVRPSQRPQTIEAFREALGIPAGPGSAWPAAPRREQSPIAPAGPVAIPSVQAGHGTERLKAGGAAASCPDGADARGGGLGAERAKSALREDPPGAGPSPAPPHMTVAGGQVKTDSPGDAAKPRRAAAAMAAKIAASDASVTPASSRAWIWMVVAAIAIVAGVLEVGYLIYALGSPAASTPIVPVKDPVKAPPGVVAATPALPERGPAYGASDKNASSSTTASGTPAPAASATTAPPPSAVERGQASPPQDGRVVR